MHESSITRKVINSSEAPEPIGPYCHAVRTGNLLFSSGQIALDPQSGEMVSGGIEEETRQVLENLLLVLKAAGLTAGDVVKTSIYLTAMSDFPKVNEIYAEYFGASCPARSTIEVAGLPKGAKVEMDVIASYPH